MFRHTAYDYEPGQDIGVLYLSFMLHLASPSYVYKRIELIKEGKGGKRLFVLLLMDADSTTPSAVHSLSQLQTESLAHKFGVIPVYSGAESARYLECMHLQEKSPMVLPDTTAQDIRATRRADPTHQLQHRMRAFLSCAPAVTATDASHLLSVYKTIKDVAANIKNHSDIKGIGKTKQRAFEAFITEPFCRE